MSTLISNININDTFPKYIPVKAPSCCGIVSLTLDDFTEQMSCELVAIDIDIYIKVNGKRVLYRPRALTIYTNKNSRSESYILLDIPQTCEFAVSPIFNEDAFKAHNEMIDIFNSTNKWKTTPGNISEEEYRANYGYILAKNDDEKWEEPTTTFTLMLNWDSTNINSSGGSGGSSPTPPTPVPVDVPSTIYYGDNATSTVSSLSGLSEVSVTSTSVTVIVNIDNYLVFVYPAVYKDVVKITDTNNFNVTDNFNKTTVTIDGTIYKAYVSETIMETSNYDYTLKFKQE